ncbi:MAG TPA: hypothetical protein PK490_20760 [Prosthecobacter sp.]|nr:hypothetical protein [Prosthecobacter sp.]HRK16725.1 hypothetical protein [Prosthecobacter sp.]
MTQPQREALFDILALAIYADAHVSLDEDELVRQAFVKRGWKSTRPKSLFIDESFARAREAAESDDAMMDYLEERAASFTTKAAQKEVCALVKDILEGDGMTAEENEFFHLLVQSLPRLK